MITLTAEQQQDVGRRLRCLASQWIEVGFLLS